MLWTSLALALIALLLLVLIAWAQWVEPAVARATGAADPDPPRAVVATARGGGYPSRP